MSYRRLGILSLLVVLITAVVVLTMGDASAESTAVMPLLDAYRVKDINPDASSFPKLLTAEDAGIYFAAETGGEAGLWRSDSMEAGTTLVKSMGSTEIEYPFADAAWAMVLA